MLHVARAAADHTGVIRVVVFGSQAVLGTFDEDELPEAVTRSVEVDIVVPSDLPSDAPHIVAAMLGPGSAFHRTFHYYADGMSWDELLLPDGWEGRTRTLRTESVLRPGIDVHVECPEIHDLCAIKLAAFRAKDRAFVQLLAAEGLIDPGTVAQRCKLLPDTTPAQIALRDQAVTFARAHLHRGVDVDVERDLPPPRPDHF